MDYTQGQQILEAINAQTKILQSIETLLAEILYRMTPADEIESDI